MSEGALVAADARVARRRGVRVHRALRHVDRALVRRARRGLPRPLRARVREGRRPAVRREPAPARRVLRAGRRAHARAVDGPQHHGKQLSYNNLLDLDAARRIAREFEVPACVIVKHNNPCGVAVGRTGAGGLRARLRAPTRSARSAAIIVAQPRGRPRRSPRSSTSSSSRSSSRPATTTRRSRSSRRRRTSASSRTTSGACRWPASATRSQVLGGLLVQDRDMDLADRARDGGRHRARADRGRVGRDALRLEGLQAREVQRDRARAGPRDGRDRRGADEPRRLGAPRGREVARRTRSRARRWPPTRSSRSPTGPSSRSRRASRRSSSRAARCATTRSSRPPTRPASRWSSRAAATSGH